MEEVKKLMEKEIEMFFTMSQEEFEIYKQTEDTSIKINNILKRL